MGTVCKANSCLADASKASAKVKEEINAAPGKGKEAEKRGEQYAHQAGAKLDSAVKYCQFTSLSTADTGHRPQMPRGSCRKLRLRQRNTRTRRARS